MDVTRYGNWPHAEMAKDMYPEFERWDDAKQEAVAMNKLDREYQVHVWDYSTTPPTDVTDANPEEVAAPAPAPLITPFIPDHVADVTFSRSPTLEGDMRVQANGPGWSISFWTTEDDALSDLADMCAQIVAKKEKRT